jgi:hypothetical protein
MQKCLLSNTPSILHGGKMTLCFPLHIENLLCSYQRPKISKFQLLQNSVIIFFFFSSSSFNLRFEQLDPRRRKNLELFTSLVIIKRGPEWTQQLPLRVECWVDTKHISKYRHAQISNCYVLSRHVFLFFYLHCASCQWVCILIF